MNSIDMKDSIIESQKRIIDSNTELLNIYRDTIKKQQQTIDEYEKTIFEGYERQLHLITQRFNTEMDLIDSNLKLKLKSL